MTALHIFAYINLSKILESSIVSNGKFIACATGETPLAIALNKRSKLCAEIIIKLFPIIYRNNPSAFNYLRDTLTLLNKASLPSLSVIYRTAFPIVQHQNLPTFGSFKVRPPVIHSSEAPFIDRSIFVKDHGDSAVLKDFELEFRQSLFSLDISPGSKKSIKFIRSLLKCKEIKIFRTEFIRTLLDYK